MKAQIENKQELDYPDSADELVGEFRMFPKIVGHHLKDLVLFGNVSIWNGGEKLEKA